MTDTMMLTLAYITDIAIGDPRGLPHPVRFMGGAITVCERYLRLWCQSSAEKGLRTAGLIMAIFIPSVTFGIFYLLTILLERSGIQIASEIIMIYLVASSLATRELVVSAGSVINAISDDDMKEAKKRLSMIVGRDTDSLDRKCVLKAVIETLSENASDGIVAPMFYFIIGGLPLAMTYKAINTLDSMVGYKNDHYRDLGWASARLDDAANFIPARITGVLIVLATFITNRIYRSRRSQHLSTLSSFKVMLRDGREHSSPNSGIPEAAMAGALGVRLGGPSTYGGKLFDKPFIGDESPVTAGNKGVETNQYLLGASNDAILLVKLTSALSLFFSLVVLHVRALL